MNGDIPGETFNIPDGSLPLLERLAVTEAAIQRVRELHKSDGFDACVECCGIGDRSYVMHPCSTIRALDGGSDD